MKYSEHIFEQVGKQRFKPSPNQWTDPAAHKIENEFDMDHVSSAEPPPTRDILNQIKKKKISKRKQKDRLADKSVQLAERLGTKAYK